MIELYDYQREALTKLRTGFILCGGVGSGKSRTSLAYYFLKECGKDLYIITTARKRDTGEWLTEWAGKKKKTRLHGDDVGQLDDIRFARADVNIYPHVHDKGIKGHCNQLVVIQAKNDLFDGAYDEYEEDSGE